MRNILKWKSRALYPQIRRPSVQLNWIFYAENEVDMSDDNFKCVPVPPTVICNLVQANIVESKDSLLTFAI